MSTEVVMPQMGESIAEGTITKWLKQVGDRVERDEPLFEISTDKVDAEIPSPAAGTLTEIRFHEGDTVEVNTTVAVVDGDTSGTAAKDAAHATEDAVIEGATTAPPKEQVEAAAQEKPPTAESAPSSAQTAASEATGAEVEQPDGSKAAAAEPEEAISAEAEQQPADTAVP